MGSEIVSNDQNSYNLLSSKNLYNSLFYVAALALHNEENCRKLFQHAFQHLKESEIDDAKHLNKLPTLRDNINLEYYSFLWRVVLSKDLPIEIFEKTSEFISNQSYNIANYNQHFGTSHGQTRKSELDQIKQKSPSDLRQDYCFGKRYGDDRMMNYISIFLDITFYEIDLTYSPDIESVDKTRIVIKNVMGMKSHYFPTKCMFIISRKTHGIDKIKQYNAISFNNKIVFTRLECEKFQKGTLICKLWSTMCNYHFSTLFTTLNQPILNIKTNIIFEGQHIDQSYRTYQDSKHFTFNKTDYIIIDKEDKSLNENYRGLLDKFQQKLLEKELKSFNDRL